MSLRERADEALDYFPCRYGSSKLLFRGPRRRTDEPFVAVLGGSETFGRFVAEPFPALVEGATGRRMMNFGYQNAGIEVFLQDKEVIDICGRAQATVVQVLGAQNLTNRFYAVHPRRNDRFLHASQLLRTLYRDLDFSQINFTRHLLATLRDHAPDRFGMVVEEVQQAWVARMKQLLPKVGGRKLLLWIGDAPPGDGSDLNPHAPDPLFVTRGMIDALSLHVSDVVEVNATPEIRARGTEGMIVAPGEEAVAQTLPNVGMHRRVAGALAHALDRSLQR
jgi:hypothetical protein